MSGDRTPAFVRTLIPIIIGPLVARFAPGVDADDPTVLLLVSAVVSYVYYVGVRYLEAYNPKLGYLLGIAKTPAYSKEDAPSPGQGEAIEAIIVVDDDEDEAPYVEDVEPEPTSFSEMRVMPISEARKIAKSAEAKNIATTPITRVPVKRTPPTF